MDGSGFEVHASDSHTKPDPFKSANAIVRSMSFRAPADATPVTPAARAAGRVRVPGDKSISHRYALLAALADGDSLISRLFARRRLRRHARLPAAARRGDRRDRPGPAAHRRTRHAGPGGPPPAPLDAGNSGTTMRLLSGIAGRRTRSQPTIGGDASLSRRPDAPRHRTADPHGRAHRRRTTAGRRCASTGADLHAIAHEPRGAERAGQERRPARRAPGVRARPASSSRSPTRDHTERALAGVRRPRRSRRRRAIAVDGGQRLSGARASRCRATCPARRSGPRSRPARRAPTSTIEDVGLNPTRTAVFDVLRRAGARVEATIARQRRRRAGRAAAHRVSAPRSFEVDAGRGPGVIDELPALAALAAMHAGGLHASPSAARRNCASRKAIASRRWRPASARSARPWRNSTTASRSRRGR